MPLSIRGSMRLTIILFIALFIAAWCPAQDIVAKDPRAAETGRWMFRIRCAPCHGIHADGGRGPDLTLGAYAAGDRDGDLFRVISRGVPGTEMAAYAGRVEDEDIWRLVAYIRSVARSDQVTIQGDIAAGETIFWSKGGCGQCHRVGARGTSLGPDLTRVGRQRSIAYLRTSILKPDADVTPGYATVTVITREGKKIVGVEKNFDNFSAQLIDLSGKYYSFVREEVTSMKREPRSLMPSTYGQILSETELNDLLAYLNSLRGGR
jgi:putative heme-binding domain-containing protein